MEIMEDMGMIGLLRQVLHLQHQRHQLLHIINNNRTPVRYKLSSPPLGIGVGVVVYKTVLLFVIPRINRKLGVGVTHHRRRCRQHASD